jgi:hypothetical protein
MDALVLAAFEQGEREFGLAQEFAAGNRDAAAGFLEKRHVAADALHDFVDGVIGAAHIQGLGGASLCARAAVIALRAVGADELYLSASVESGFLFTGCYGFMRAHVKASPTFFDPDALDFHPIQFRLESLRFGAVAPRASQRAPLKEKRQAYTGSIVDGKTLDVVEFPCELFVVHIQISCSFFSIL